MTVIGAQALDYGGAIETGAGGADGGRRVQCGDVESSELAVFRVFTWFDLSSAEAGYLSPCTYSSAVVHVHVITSLRNHKM